MEAPCGVLSWSRVLLYLAHHSLTRRDLWGLGPFPSGSGEKPCLAFLRVTSRSASRHTSRLSSSSYPLGGSSRFHCKILLSLSNVNCK